jgi:sugar lactone lactonase YvrE
MNLKRTTPILRIGTPIILGVSLALVAAWTGSAWENDVGRKLARTNIGTGFLEKPVYVGSLSMDENDRSLQPYAICNSGDYFLVSYLHSNRIDIFDRKLENNSTIDVSLGAHGSITGLAADDSVIYVADSQRGDIRGYTYQGELSRHYNRLPDGNPYRPHALALNEGILYVIDRNHRQVLAINVDETRSHAQGGEIIYSSPPDPVLNPLFSAPNAIMITPDGRTLVTDQDPGQVKVLGCDGRYAHQFRRSEEEPLLKPNGIALDNMQSPHLLAMTDSVFIPSGIYQQGRFHVVDSEAGDVKVFDATGEYLFAYGDELEEPTDITLNQTTRAILISDVGLNALMVYKY